MTEINWTAPKEEKMLIIKIAKRAAEMAKDADIEYELIDAQMDIAATHLNGTPLDLERMLEADDANFGHDVFGIRRHINRTNGQLEDCFLPRMTKKEEITVK